jgi:hypothetical protein
MMKAIRLLVLIPVALTASSCGITTVDEPLFGPKQPRYVFGDHRPDPVLPGDAIITKKQAIQLAMKNCPPAKRDTDMGFWDAHIEGNNWLVYYEHNTAYISAKINKSNGAFEDCQVNDQDE